MLPRLAWRNLWRQRTRTLILISAVTFSYALLLVAMGVGDDSHQQMLDAAVEGAGGDVLVHRDGYWSTLAADLVLPDGLAVAERARGVEGVAEAIPRIRLPALVSTADGARAVDLLAVDPLVEEALVDIHEHLVEGERLDATALESPILLGIRMAEDLETEVGGRVVLTASGWDGELTRALFRVAGFLETGIREVDETLAYTTLQAAWGALGDSATVTQVGVLVQEGTDVEVLAEALREGLGRDGVPVEVLTWRQAVPEMVGFIETDDAFLYIYAAVMFVVVAFAIANTFLVAVTERVREFGLLNALGLRGRRIGVLVLVETAVLTLVAVGVGFAIALAGHLAIDHWGIPIAIWGMEDMELAGVNISDMVMRSQITTSKWIVATVAVMVTTVGSAVFAAVKAARLVPAEAMRFYE
ncbi:MAG: ABC transporter permease [Gemmatimonadales bacterium]|jgi:ABC-type lipoprotein release transport system permease subunit|nr:MAG: ABC transporter permease [Gemmatimonadales bacterium]